VSEILMALTLNLIMLRLNMFLVEADEVVTVNLSMLYESFKH